MMDQPLPLRNSSPLSLHIPEPKARPGDRPNFGDLQVPPAGSVARPDSAVPAGEVRDFAYALIRVLDETGAAVGPWDPGLDSATLRRGLRAMLLTRIYDDRMYRVQ